MSIHDDFATIKRYLESCVTVEQVAVVAKIRHRFIVEWARRKADSKTRTELWATLMSLESTTYHRVQSDKDIRDLLTKGSINR